LFVYEPFCHDACGSKKILDGIINLGY